MVAVPAKMPETKPDVDGIVATAVLLLLQVPAVVELVRVVVDASQSVAVPDIAAGTGETFTAKVLKQPGDNR